MSQVFSKLHDGRDLLSKGAVLVIPTDTIYCLACIASDTEAVNRLYKTSGRTKEPGTVLGADISQLVKLGIKARYLKPIEHYWPGLTSILIPNHELVYLHLGKGVIATRLPADKSLQAFLKQTGPLLVVGARPPGKQTASTIKQAQHYFGDRVDGYVDGGDLSKRQLSTLIRVVDDEVEVLRQGAVRIGLDGQEE